MSHLLFFFPFPPSTLALFAAFSVQAAGPNASQELSELDQMGLQDAVLERLRTLCDKDVDPKVGGEVEEKQ